MRFSPTQISEGDRLTRSRSGNTGDPVDFQQRGLALADRVEGGVAQEARAGALRRLLELAHRRAAGDQLAQLVVEDHQLGDRLAAPVAPAAALAAAAPDQEFPAFGVL